jgi:hypothetical protein
MPQKKRDNPYDPNRPASASMFIGREKLCRQLTTGLGTGRCFELTGGPGIGKTSLLMRVRRDLVTAQLKTRQGALPVPVYVECRRAHKQAENVLVEIADRLVEALSEQRGLTCPLSLRDKARLEAVQGGLETALNSLLEWAFSRERVSHLPILLLDDLHRLSGEPCLQRLVSILHPLVNRKQIGFALASQRSLTGELRDDVSLLRMLISQRHRLEMLNRKETRELVTKAIANGWKVEDGCGELTGGHPYKLHYYLYGALAAQDKLTTKGLSALHTIETLRHLERVVGEEALTAVEVRSPSRSSAGRKNLASVFISYSHKDEAEKEALRLHLGVLGNAGLIDIWSDDRIDAGGDWQREIARAIAGARVAILLISKHFLNSDFILRQEVPALLERRMHDGLVVFPVIATACAWEKVEWLAKLNAKPKNGKPIWSDGGRHADEDLAEIARQVAEVVRGDVLFGAPPQRDIAKLRSNLEP